MSCFIVQNESISRIASYLASFHMRDEFSTHIPADIARAAGLLMNDDPELFARALREMNEKAFRARYCGRHECDWHPFVFEFTAAPSLLELCRLLACYLYQCAEGDVGESPLYLAVKEWHYNAVDKIVAALPDYSSLPWD